MRCFDHGTDWFAITSAVRPSPDCGRAKKRANRNAPLALTKPAPCSSGDTAGAACAVYCRMALTAFGVSDGLASSISATVPATTGAAMLVPVRLRYGL